jgi:hypothetical protein
VDQVLLVRQLLEMSLRRVVAALAMDSLMVDRNYGVGGGNILGIFVT